jgi:nucleotidyltransferase/DNA polymerase involved in DNA repair
VSVLYCTIPYFAAALAQRDDPDLAGRPLILVGPEGRVFDTSAEAAASGVAAGMTARAAEVRCPAARLLEADMARCRAELDGLFQVLERASPKVEPHGWGAAYADLGDLAHDRAEATGLLRIVGQAVRRELGEPLQPALGWDTSKFTAQAAARCTQPGRLLTVAGVRERTFLSPLPMALLPLDQDTVQRLSFLGLRTLGQYAALPPAAVWQQFGRPGKLAHRCARGEDDRPVIPRGQRPQLMAEIELEAPLVEQGGLAAALRHLASPLLAELRGNLQACGQVRLVVRFDDGSAQERSRVFLFPTAGEDLVGRALEQLLAAMHWPAPVVTLAVILEQIQDAAAEQMALFPLQDVREEKLCEVERYLAARFGASRLRRAVLAQPGAPLPEWRVGWQEGEGVRGMGYDAAVA